MYVCRLFHRDQPAEPVEVRMLESGRLTVGRDPAADWPLDDAQGTLSRIHFTLAVENGALTLTDSSTNGTFLGNGARAPRDVGIPLGLGEAVRFGALILFVEEQAGAAGDDRPQMLPFATTTLPSGWADGAAPAAPRHRDESLIEAFCEGAGIDSSGLSGEDPAELMRRLGAIYQQAVLGIATLTAERTRFKNEHRLDRTTIGAVHNNPFKWAPTRRLGQSLLCRQEPGFLSGAEAVRASFDDTARHLAGLSAGGNAALAAVLDRLAPESVEQEAGGQGFPRLRSGAFRDALVRRHAGLSGSDRAIIDRAFAEAYLEAGGE